MITINLSLASLELIISRLERFIIEFHQRALDLYPDSGYEAMDSNSIECRHSLDFLVLTKSLKELELGYRNIETEIQYFNFRIAQLEKFLHKNIEQHTSDLMSVIADLHFKLVEKKHQKNNCTNQVFTVEIPEHVAITLKHQGLLIDTANIDTN